MSGFLDKLISSIPFLNNWLLRDKKRLTLIEEGKEMPSPSLRSTVNIQFYREVEALGRKYVDPGFKLSGTSDDTNSMEPAIDGHMVMLVPLGTRKPYRFMDLVEGDIVWFRRALDGAENVLHRIIQLGDDWVVTRGDNTVIPDGTTLKKDIKGVCVGMLY